MLGYWLAFPVLCVLGERTLRIVRGFRGTPSRVEALDEDTVVITAMKPEGVEWGANAGQYVSMHIFIGMIS